MAQREDDLQRRMDEARRERRDDATQHGYDAGVAAERARWEAWAAQQARPRRGLLGFIAAGFQAGWTLVVVFAVGYFLGKALGFWR